MRRAETWALGTDSPSSKLSLSRGPTAGNQGIQRGLTRYHFVANCYKCAPVPVASDKRCRGSEMRSRPAVTPSTNLTSVAAAERPKHPRREERDQECHPL